MASLARAATYASLGMSSCEERRHTFDRAFLQEVQALRVTESGTLLFLDVLPLVVVPLLVLRGSDPVLDSGVD